MLRFQGLKRIGRWLMAGAQHFLQQNLYALTLNHMNGHLFLISFRSDYKTTKIIDYTSAAVYANLTVKCSLKNTLKQVS